jgi:hypothetical protein
MKNGQKPTRLVPFAKPFTNKLKDAASIKGNAVMFMRKDVYDHIVGVNKMVESDRSSPINLKESSSNPGQSDKH